MGQSNEDSVPPPLPLFVLLRWSVPTLYLICVAFICASLWEDYQRVTLAEEVARVINEQKPATIGELETLLASRLGERLADYPTRYNPLHSLRGYQLLPRVWLTLWVTYKSETGNIVDAGLTYAGSDRVSLEAPREGLPRVPNFEWFVAIFPAVICSTVWLRFSRFPMAPAGAQGAVAILSALPLLLYIIGALIAYIRVTM